MNILEDIIQHKWKEIRVSRETIPVEMLEQSVLFNRTTLSLESFLGNKGNTGIIAEFKRRSPSKGIINDQADPATVTRAYTEFGAVALSVLTDGHFFGGSFQDLSAARVNIIPLLRKDFIVDEYQVVETKAMGADIILLIAACLTARRTGELAELARKLQLEVLLEINNEAELGHICEAVNHVGVNNRDLRTFEVDMEKSIELGERIPADKTRIAESGIRSLNEISQFRQAGFRGFLMGEKFMREIDPGKAFKDFVDGIK